MSDALRDVVRVPPQVVRLRGEDQSTLALARVAQYYAETVGKADMLQYVCQRIREARREPMATHQLIAALPFKIIVSTNYDCLIEWALEAEGKSFNVIVTDKQVPSWDEGAVNKYNNELKDLSNIAFSYQSYSVNPPDSLFISRRRKNR